MANINTSQLAALFKVDVRTIQLWAKNKGLPRVDRDTYDFVEVVMWRFQQYEKEIDELKKTSAQDLLAQRNAELKELMIAEKKGQLVDKNEVSMKWVEELNFIINNLTGFAVRVANKLVGKKEDEIIEIINDEIENIKQKIATSDLNL